MSVAYLPRTYCLRTFWAGVSSAPTAKPESRMRNRLMLRPEDRGIGAVHNLPDNSEQAGVLAQVVVQDHDGAGMQGRQHAPGDHRGARPQIVRRVVVPAEVGRAARASTQLAPGISRTHHREPGVCDSGLNRAALWLYAGPSWRQRSRRCPARSRVSEVPGVRCRRWTSAGRDI